MEETTFLERFGINALLCFVGLLGYTLFSVRNNLNQNFDRKKFWNDNIVFWAWVISAQILYAGVMSYFPELEKWLSTKLISILEATAGIPLEIPEDLINVVIYLTLTWQLSRYVNKGVSPSDKIGTKKQV